MKSEVWREHWAPQVNERELQWGNSRRAHPVLELMGRFFRFFCCENKRKNLSFLFFLGILLRGVGGAQGGGDGGRGCCYGDKLRPCGVGIAADFDRIL